MKMNLGRSIICSGIMLLVCFGLLNYAQDTEQKIFNKIPKHLPIKVEILNPDAENFLRDVRIKITNTGEKPIYFLELFISTDKNFLAPDGNQYGFKLTYGRNKLVDVNELANKEDIPLRKGEFYIFKVDEKYADSSTENLQRNYSATPESYLLEFQMLNFGDGTGFLGSKANAVSSSKKVSQTFNHAPPKEIENFFLLRKKSQPVHPNLRL